MKHRKILKGFMIVALLTACNVAAPASGFRVNVMNTEDQPVPVVTENERNVRTPFGQSVNVAFGTFRGIATSSKVAGDDFEVPGDSILVIEYISLRATIDNADQIAFVEVRSQANGTLVDHVLPVSTDVASLPAGSTQKIVSYGWPIKLYIDAGSTVILNLNSTTGSPSGSAGYRVSGYLVPVESPLLGE